MHNLWRLCTNRKELSIKLANGNRELTNEENQNLFEEVKNVDGQLKHTSKLTSRPLDVKFYINHIEKNIYSLIQICLKTKKIIITLYKRSIQKTNFLKSLFAVQLVSDVAKTGKSHKT